jgi:LmbE family N-acetylglucosaminyl deacetylase
VLKEINNILVLAPHTDDGELGAGGFIHQAIKQGVNVYYVAFSAAEDSVPVGFERDCLRYEVLNATSRLGLQKSNVEVLDYKVRSLPARRQDVLDDLIKIRRARNYDLVLTPNTTDIHQDHSTVTNEVIRAFKNTNIWGYELIWNNLSSDSNCFVELSDSDVEAKCAAMSEYKSQQGRNYTSSEFIRALAKTRGVQASLNNAERYQVIRQFIKGCK